MKVLLIYIVTWVAELIGTILCIHGVFKKEIRFSLSLTATLLMDVIIFGLCQYKIVPNSVKWIGYGIILIYCFQCFKRLFWETICIYIFGILLSIVSEVGATFLAYPLESIVEKNYILIGIMSLASLLLSYTIYWVGINKDKYEYRAAEKSTRVLIILGVFAVLVIVSDYAFRGIVEGAYYIIFLGLIVVIFLYHKKQQKIRLELEKIKIETELQEIYGDAYKELLFEVRRKQHDFKNQIGAIYSMHLTATSLEDLINKQKEYGYTVLNSDPYEIILIGCNHPILAGFIYNKCIQFEREGILVECEVVIDDASCVFRLHEIIEVLGILLTNAYEHLLENKYLERKIYVKLQETKNTLYIEVENRSEYKTVQELEKMFEQGYSTKGEYRGIGLARIKQLCKKYKIEIKVENIQKDQENWLSFKMSIPRY